MIPPYALAVVLLLPPPTSPEDLRAQSEARLLVTRVARQRVEFVLMDGNGKEERILHSHPLTFRRGTEVHDENHNESLHRSLACAVNADGTTIAVLELISSRPAPLPEPEEIPEPNGWTSRANLITIDLRGRVLRARPAELRAKGELFLGFGDDGKATLIEEIPHRQFWVLGDKGWRRTPLERLPRSFRTVSAFPPPPEMEDLVRRVRGQNSLFPESVYRTPAWFDAGLPTFEAVSTVLLSRNPRTDAALAYTTQAIAARWGERTERIALTGRALEYVSPLAHPWVVGRISPRLALLPEYAPYPIVPMDPFIESTLWKLNLATGERVRLGNGIYAIPIGNERFRG